MSTGKRVLIVDDDDALRQSLAEQLRLHEEFLTDEAETGAAALEATKGTYFDVILLDVGLPDMDGREVCRLMRRAGVKSPIVMLTGAGTDSDTILGLDAGANDYVTKPFKLGVLLARLRAQLRQHEQSEDAVFTIGPFTFRPSAKLLLDEASNSKVRLTEKGDGDPQIPVPGRRQGGRPRRLVERGMGLQRRYLNVQNQQFRRIK